ncbi:helix-turn-helix domain-containing protein [Kitasatospora acidiphila]|uniref:Helix-turn-helix domain-containing protein n=2 Tax=Kitasatospora acidiphila TaxID=2567942 RepID=A0A540W6G6_9ACTN|nr:helix-turn-helix domain-containing protein [Kitasatospora acidiphila]
MRESAGFSLKDAGAVIGMGAPQLSHVEAGRTGVSPDRVKALLASYECNDEPFIRALIDLGSQDGSGWWSEYSGAMPGHALDLAEMESTSRHIASYEILHIPGLLQTPGYTEAIYEYRFDQGGEDRALEFRKERQRILLESAAPQCDFVIHEAALRMSFAGRRTMREQLIHLLDMSENPAISIQVMPFAVDESSPYPSSFFICSPGNLKLATVGVDHPSKVEYLTAPQELESYRSTFAQLAQVSSPPARPESPHRNSWGLIQAILLQF